MNKYFKMKKFIIILFTILLITFGLDYFSEELQINYDSKELVIEEQVDFTSAEYIRDHCYIITYSSEMYYENEFSQRYYDYRDNLAFRSKYAPYIPYKYIDHNHIKYIDEQCYEIQSVIENDNEIDIESLKNYLHDIKCQSIYTKTIENYENEYPNCSKYCYELYEKYCEEMNCWIGELLILYLNNYHHLNDHNWKQSEEYIFLDFGLNVLKSFCDTNDEQICSHIFQFIE